MRLNIGNFPVHKILFGQETKWEDGVLTVNRQEAIAALNADGKLKNVDLQVAYPGESVRILPVHEIVEPRAALGGRPTFPGYTGPLCPAGEGTLHALKGMSVMAVGKYGGWMEGILDMSGPMAERTHYADLINLCFVAENVDPEENSGQVQHKNLNFRLAAHRLAEYLAQAVRDQKPRVWEQYELTDVHQLHLPRVALVIQLSSFYDKMDGFDDLLYGIDVRLMIPSLLHPNEVLDGAVCGSALITAGQRFYTYDYQNFPILKKLYQEHGKTIDFAGVIISDIGQTTPRKIRSAIRVAKIAQTIGCDGAIYASHGDGNLDVDFFKTIGELEKVGIKTVGMGNEAPGRDGTSPIKSMLDPVADAMVAAGNGNQVIELPPMERIIGDLDSVMRDKYPGCWQEDEVYGPSLRPDGSIIMDAHSIVGHDGASGWSHMTMKSF